MSDETNQDALKALYQMAMDGEELTGMIYEPKESDDLVLVFKNHTITISYKADLLISNRNAKAGDRSDDKLLELRSST